jgi:glycerol-3-phosphate acyltransferase PlsY
VAGSTRYISLGSICGALAAGVAAIVAFFIGIVPFELAIYIVATSGMIVVSHHDNISRLRAGAERRLGQREETLDSPPAEVSEHSSQR